MMRISKQAWTLTALLLAAILAVSCGFRRKAYENPITKDTQQPDKVLFDKAIRDIERGRYEIARLTLNTLINTYDASEFLAKAKLAIADSWYREGGGHGMAQAEAEYKDFILFYPTMEEAAESQEKICMIHYKEMDKADRDPNNALRAEQECRQLLVQFPNSKFAPSVEQRLREIQEVLAEAEMRAGDFYHHKGNNAAAANRLGALVDQYPLYSRADEALWLQADSYGRMGPRFRPQTGQAYAKLIKDYPLSPYASQARKKLESMELPIPEADPAAVARMKYEAENRTKAGLVQKSTSFLRRGPEVSSAAKAGSPTMKNPVASIPVSVPVPAAAGGFSGDVTVAPVGANSALDSQPDARAGAAGSAAGAATDGATAPAAGTATGSSASPTTSVSGASPQQPVDLPDPKAKKKKPPKKKKNENDTKATQ
jgi:outer membrane protein assembly factor BamD